MPDARLGPMESVLNAQPDGSSMPLESANKSLLNAEPGPPLVNAKLVIQVTSLLKDNASKIQTPSYQLPTTSALFGTVEFVSSVPTEPTSMKAQSAEKFQLNAPLGMPWTESA